MARYRDTMSHLRVRRVRALIYARYSTDEQNHSSIDDQVAYCQRYLERHGITDVEIETLFDAETSGELVSRPGIDQVREGIAARRWDLIVVEDCSRLFRHASECLRFLESSVDAGIQVLAINDSVDTGADNWQDRAHAAAGHHARANRDTSQRIKRSMEGRWAQGAAVSYCRTGYRRNATHAATRREPEEGPFFDEIDSNWAPVVREAYERIAGNEPSWSVAAWLMQRGLPKRAYSDKTKWQDRDVIALIRQTIYRGLDRHRERVAVTEHCTGRHLPRRNNPDEVLTREMPHLRIVDDSLWHRANDVIAERNRNRSPRRGPEHSLAGVPRDSRGPLSGLFLCGICNGKMHMDGRREGGYVCSNAARGQCWNKATALRDLTHERIGQAIHDALLDLDGVPNLIVEEVQRRLLDDGPTRNQLAELRRRETTLESAQQRLLAAIENDSDAPEVLTERLRARQSELDQVRANIEMIQANLVQREVPPTRETILEAACAMAGRMTALCREDRAVLQHLIGPVYAVPFQQFGSNLVVLRARFELRLLSLLPQQWRALFDGDPSGPLLATFASRILAVDLFRRSTGPAHFQQALAWADAGRTRKKIGQALGISAKLAQDAVQYGRALRAAGLSDPYSELRDPPLAASRWRTHARYRRAE